MTAKRRRLHLTDSPISERLFFERFTDSDVTALAELLSDPEITRNVTANAAGPARALSAAKKRIAWHNAAWESHGYGVWALRSRDPVTAPPERVIGWCGFTPADHDGEDPEILYGLARPYWGRGLAIESARVAVDWLFRNTEERGTSAVIAGKLNPGSVAVSKKLGMREIGQMHFTEFLPDPVFAREVLDYELWRLEEGPSGDTDSLLFQTVYRSGQLSVAAEADLSSVTGELIAAAHARPGLQRSNLDEIGRRIAELVQRGAAHPFMDCLHLSKAEWQG